MSSPKHLSLLEANDEPTTVEPARVMLGRYELVAELGHGGMASVHLARTRGPAGFSKWFAIKQIHPHLAKDQRFVSMFLDEARIAASVDHPNVAQVLELGEVDGAYFIAMEYLHGETLGRLVSRSYKHGDGVDPHMAAHLVAAAATGLHAAHDGKDAEGRPLDLVHRDVSPQNIFITFDGRVKVTDFGVAKASNRISKTQTGTAKGKVAYMAPEQALSGVVDRRTDVFALGVLLWECVTGRRLFKAATEAQTLMRITGGKVPKPSSFAHECPAALERIILRALERRAEDRYPSALAMARDLEAFLLEEGVAIRPRDVSEVMSSRFADTKHTRGQMLRSQEGARVAPPADEVSLDDLPQVTSSPNNAAPSSSVVRAVFPKRDSRALVALALMTVLAAGAGWMALSSDGFSDAVTVQIESAPAGARVRLDGEWLSDTAPTSVGELEPGTHQLRLELEGFDALETEIHAAEGERVRLRYALTPAEVEAVVLADAPPNMPDAADSAPAAQVAPTPSAPETQPVQAPVAEMAPTTSPDVRMVSMRASATRVRTPQPSTTPTAMRTPSPPGSMEDAPAEAPGVLEVVSLPFASVRINGGPAATTPISNARVPAGRVVLRYQHRGTGEEQTRIVRVRPGQSLRVNLTQRR